LNWNERGFSMDKLIELISELISKLNPKGRWKAIGAIFIIIIIVLLIIESIAGFNFFLQMQKKVGLIKELAEISTYELDENSQLYGVYQDAIDQLSNYSIKPFKIHFPKINSQDLFKALSGGSVWLLFSILGFFGQFGENNKIIAGVLLLLIAILFGWIGIIIPVVITPWINYIGFPFIQLIILIWLGKLAGKRKNRTPASDPQQ